MSFILEVRRAEIEMPLKIFGLEILPPAEIPAEGIGIVRREALSRGCIPHLLLSDKSDFRRAADGRVIERDLASSGCHNTHGEGKL